MGSRGRQAAAVTTIRDVARRAGVSATTVSHVINRTRKVDAITAARVEAAISEMGYRPNALARSMRRGPHAHRRHHPAGHRQPLLRRPRALAGGCPLRGRLQRHHLQLGWRRAQGVALPGRAALEEGGRPPAHRREPTLGAAPSSRGHRAADHRGGPRTWRPAGLPGHGRQLRWRLPGRPASHRAGPPRRRRHRRSGQPGHVGQAAGWLPGCARRRGRGDRRRPRRAGRLPGRRRPDSHGGLAGAGILAPARSSRRTT